MTLYAHWKVNVYTAAWNGGTGYTITVKRTSSPNQGASIGNINSGTAVYYGDVLNITYAQSKKSHRIVNPTVCETSFSEEYLRDEKSYEMYSVIRSSGVYDLNWNFGFGNASAHVMADVVR